MMLAQIALQVTREPLLERVWHWLGRHLEVTAVLVTTAYVVVILSCFVALARLRNRRCRQP